MEDWFPYDWFASDKSRAKKLGAIQGSEEKGLGLTVRALLKVSHRRRVRVRHEKKVYRRRRFHCDCAGG